MSKKQTILIADSQYLITEALRVILSQVEHVELVAVVRSVFELERVLSKSAPNLLIMDHLLLDFKSVQDIDAIKSHYPATFILILTNQLNRTELSDLNKIGIKNILYKTADKEEVLEAISAALKGKKYYSSELVDMLMDDKDKRKLVEEKPSLTVSEKEIIRLIANGLTTKDIAMKKNISFHTVMSHRKNIFRKLAINNVSELLMYAMKNGIIDTIEYYI